MRSDRYVIECRTPEGKLDFTGQQPEAVFGMEAIQGISEDRMAKVIFRHDPDAVLTGDRISAWPSVIDSRWIARRKTW